MVCASGYIAANRSVRGLRLGYCNTCSLASMTGRRPVAIESEDGTHCKHISIAMGDIKFSHWAQWAH